MWGTRFLAFLIYIIGSWIKLLFYKILSNNTYYIFKNRRSSYIYENENDPEKVDNFKFYLLFGIVDDTNNIYDNLQATDNTELKDNYANSITSSKTNYKLTLLYET